MNEADAPLGRAWRDDAPWELLTRLTELDSRFGGHPGERRAAEIVAAAFEDAGLRNVHEQAFDVVRWNRGSTELAVETDAGRRAFEAVALPYSPAATVEGPLVDAGYGTPSELEGTDVEDAVVVASTGLPPDATRHHHRMEKVGHAVESGAAAFVFANHVPGQLPPTGALREGVQGAIAGVGVSHETGEWLREYAGDARAILRVEASTEPAHSRNVRADLGPESDERVLVVAHYDAHDVAEGALDNGCGVAVALGAARILATLELERRVEVAALGCEELGLQGSEALADAVEHERVHAVVNVDGAGRFRNVRALPHCSSATEAAVREVTGRLDHPLSVDPSPHPYSDHWPFLRAGIPTLQLHSDDPEASHGWERGWTHTRADTRDKADVRTIREHAMIAALVVRELAARDVGRVDSATVRERLIERGAEPGMRAAGVWPGAWE